MKHLSGYPNWFFWLLVAAMFAAILSGFYLLPWVAEFKLQWQVPIELSYSYRLPGAVIHVLTGWTLLMLLGALWHSHIRAGWRKKRNHYSGVIQSMSLLLLALTGVGLYYLGSEDSQLFASVLHTLFGVSLCASFTWHFIHGLTLQKKLQKNKPRQV
ncbi:hypothetical protein [Shewanella sp.]|uniref:hypothetical protein n=1 Tax=Shewanella sp. TaxID=50422 RepID=UPI0040470AEA